MKWNCDLIQDLLPLYEEDLCSPASRQAVREHLLECESCRRLTAPLPIEEPKDTPEADRAVKKSMRKVKRRWLASLLAAVLAVPLLLLGINQHRGYGLCFTNLDEVYTAWRYLHALETQDWEKAARMHDFSDDYDSILDALELDVASWGTTFVPCDLAGYDYAARIALDQSDCIPKTPEALYGFLYNRQGTAMIPLELWEQLMAIDPAAFDQNGWQYWLNGELYGRITTSWGDYVVSEGRGYDTAYEYATCFSLIPAAIYEEAQPALEAEALRQYTVTHEHLDWVAELTEAEFRDEMIRRYAADLGSLEDTVTFDCTGFRSAARMDGRWYVMLSVTITQDGRTLDAEMGFHIADGKLTVGGISAEPGVQWLDAISRALYPSAHPEY